MKLGPGTHLILGKQVKDIDWAIDVIYQQVMMALNLTEVVPDEVSKFVCPRCGHDEHWKVISDFMKKTQETKQQFFVATMSPAVIDCMKFASAEDAQARIIFANKAPTSFFSRMSDDEARRLYEAYKSGYQHVSEILRVEGLW